MNSSLKAGLFVIGGIILFVASIALLGVFDHFQEKAFLMTLVPESVQGLTPGSQVKYQGVPIGKVQDITINTNGRLIRIDMEINLSKFRTEKNNVDRITGMARTAFYEYIRKDISEGLRCKLEPDGITGQKYIELDFVDKGQMRGKFIEEPDLDASQYFYVPSVPSIISDLRTSFVSFLEKIESVDYPGISKRLSQTLDSAETLMKSPKLDKTLSNMEDFSSEAKRLVRSLNESVSEHTMRKFVGSAEKIMTSVQSMTKYVEQETRKAQLAHVAREFRETMNALRESSRDFRGSLGKLDDGIDTLVEFIQYLDDDPSALLRGKQKPRLSE